MPNTSFFYTTPIYEPFGQALTKRLIHAQQAAFRYGYLMKAWCYCNAYPVQHFHRRVRRVGHLPMLTVKELPE